MYSERFQQFIEMWRKDFAIERSMNEKVCVDRDGNPIPWYTYPAIEYLSQFDYSNKNIFEFGTGYSSMYWSKRAKTVTSVEDKPEWYEKFSREFHADNWQMIYCDEKQGYEDVIQKNKQKYDVIIIDGKRRAECAQNAVKALAEGGMIILDDSDRINTSLEYFNAVKILREADLLQVDFYGFCPMNNYTKTTSVFFSRSFAFKSLYEVQPINGLGNIWSMSRKERKAFFHKQDYPLKEEDM
ncbi:MAG: class I SAM-dependent methyltransferase [Alphaproteobacteria bacterium]|nr:class I SAM-dependent methyltransferase [Alphaproteobacteria bacterium]